MLHVLEDLNGQFQDVYLIIGVSNIYLDLPTFVVLCHISKMHKVDDYQSVSKQS